MKKRQREGVEQVFIRFLRNNTSHYGVKEEGQIHLLQGDLFGDYEVTAETVSEQEIQLLPPCEPSKIICVGRNYRAHAEEMNAELPEEPLLFLKPNSSLISDGQSVVYPRESSRVDHEAELAIIIGKKARRITEEQATDHIFGYTCALDMTARDIQRKDGQWTRGKSFDTFCPVGPGIVSTVNLEDAAIEMYVNGEVRQKSNINRMIFSVPYLVSYISQAMTLLPGDVILTGTPEGVGPVNPGDQLTMRVEGVGELSVDVKNEV